MTDKVLTSEDNLKIKLLKLIRDERTTLFSAFSPTITNKKKQETWEKIAKAAAAEGLVPAHKNGKYIRDVYWQNIRRRTIKKIDNSHTTGAAGGTDMALDELDNLVMDIIGKW